MKQKWVSLKGETDKCTIIVEATNTPLLEVDRNGRQRAGDVAQW
jgi:hypothetical protein